MNSTEALEVIDKKLAKKIKPPLNKAEMIEAMAQALYNKRLANYTQLQAQYTKAKKDLHEAVKLVAKDYITPESIGEPYFYSGELNLEVSIRIKIPKVNMISYMTAIIANPEPSRSLNPDIWAIKRDLKQQLANKPALRVAELLKDEKIQKKFLQAGEELLAKDIPEAKTITLR